MPEVCVPLHGELVALLILPFSLNDTIAAKLNASKSHIFSELWVIYCPNGWDGVENVLLVLARGPTGSGGVLLPLQGWCCHPGRLRLTPVLQKNTVR